MVAVSTITIYTILLVVLLVVYIGWRLVTVARRKQAAELIDEETFTAGMHKAQVVDVRERKDFNAGHILGARNVPYSTLRAYYNGLRKDTPIYLYDQGKEMSTRSAIFLHKKGFKNLYILKTGYNRWEGKTKKSQIWVRRHLNLRWQKGAGHQVFVQLLFYGKCFSLRLLKIRISGGSGRLNHF